MIKIENFGVSFNKKTILENVNFSVKQGEIITLLGQSGCGKTTILRSIAGLHRDHDGQIFINKICVSSKNIFAKNRSVGYIFQDYALFPHINVAENIGFAVQNKEKKAKKIDELLEKFDLVEHKNKHIHQLSGGQQQRVAIARAMANDPSILLLDEPFANLDEALRFEMKMYLKEFIKNNNLSAILVTHDKTEALNLSDKIGIIDKKRLICFDETTNLYNDPKSLKEALILSEINIIPNRYLNIEDTKNKIATIKIQECFLGDKGIKINIIESFFCGEYFENIALFENGEKIKIRSQIKPNKKEVFLNFNAEKLNFLKA